MFRDQWDQIESDLQSKFSDIRNRFLGSLSKGSQKMKENFSTPEEKLKSKDDFLKWGEKYVEKLKGRLDNEKINDAKDNFFVLLRNLGINDQVLKDAFVSNKKEILDPLIGESIAVVALVLGWSKKDKEAFSQALGEIGVVGVFAAKPFICLIAICGLAYGYHRSFHKEAFKKGGVLGIAGLTAAWIAPAGFVGLLAAIVTMVYFNKKLSVDKPIENQLKEIFQQIRSGDFFSEVRGAWRNFEDFLNKLMVKEEVVEN